MRTKMILLHTFLVLTLQFLMLNAKAQNEKPDPIKAIEVRSQLWNASYNNRDSLTFYTLFDTAAVMSTAAGHWIGLEVCKNLCRGLYRWRPDITWDIQHTKIEVYEHWNAAYETGNWTEAWTERGDSSKSVIKGKYWILWDFKYGNWVISSAIFSPLSCTGSYCNK